VIVKKLPNGNLLVPFRAETDGVVGDGVKEIEPSDPEYQRWLAWVDDTPPAPPAESWYQG
jgi:hypothetical protein